MISFILTFVLIAGIPFVNALAQENDTRMTNGQLDNK